jgi:hypothetical protein
MANGEWLEGNEWRIANGELPIANRQFLLLPFFVPRPSSLALFPSVVVKPFCWRP